MTDALISLFKKGNVTDVESRTIVPLTTPVAQNFFSGNGASDGCYGTNEDEESAENRNAKTTQKKLLLFSLIGPCFFLINIATSKPLKHSDGVVRIGKDEGAQPRIIGKSGLSSKVDQLRHSGANVGKNEDDQETGNNDINSLVLELNGADGEFLGYIDWVGDRHDGMRM